MADEHMTESPDDLFIHRFRDTTDARRVAATIQSLVDCPLGAAFREGDLEAQIFASKVEWEPVLYLSRGARAAARLAGVRLPETEGLATIDRAMHPALLRASQAGPSYAPDAPGAPMRILIIEDHEDTATGLAELLRSWNFSAVIARTGAEALRTAMQFRPRVVLLDLGLPDQHGYAVARAMREQTGREPLSFIVLTGWAQPVDQTLSMNAGISHHMIKPVNLQALRMILEDYQELHTRVTSHP